jgi:hypothetical protein
MKGRKPAPQHPELELLERPDQHGRDRSAGDLQDASQNFIFNMHVNCRHIAGNITASAAGRLTVVQARIDELRRKADFDPVSAEEYHAFVEERGHLDLIVADSRAD